MVLYKNDPLPEKPHIPEAQNQKGEHEWKKSQKSS